MENYKEMIDDLLGNMEAELASANELTTKAINHEYYMGMLFGLYKDAEKNLPLNDFISLYSYRREDRERINKEANEQNINKVYKLVRAASASESKNNTLELAKRVYDIDIYENRNNDTEPEDIAEEIKKNPTEVIKYLLDIIDDLTA